MPISCPTDSDRLRTPPASDRWPDGSGLQAGRLPTRPTGPHSRSPGSDPGVAALRHPGRARQTEPVTYSAARALDEIAVPVEHFGGQVDVSCTGLIFRSHLIADGGQPLVLDL